MSDITRISLDAMGGDNAPGEMIKGAVEAVSYTHLDVYKRQYSMEGVPLTNPPQWFGASKKEQGSGAIFPAQILTALYSLTKSEKYLKSAERAAYFVYGN